MTKDKSFSLINYDDLQSKTMDWLRFPLMVLVLFIHTGIHNFGFPSQISYIPYYFISQILARIAVPLFFIISGYYFFKNKDGQILFTKEMYLMKIKKRIRTLLVPYLLWNIFVIAIYNIGRYVIKGSFYPLSFSVMALWNTGGAEPMAFQFWYIQRLMILMLLSPLVYVFLRYMKIIPVLIFAGLWLMKVPILDGRDFNSQALCFFFIGTYFGIYQLNLVQFARKFSYFSVIGFALFSIITLCLGGDMRAYCSNIAKLFGIIATIYCVSYGIEKQKLKPTPLLTSSAFFLFGIHVQPLTSMVKILLKILPMNDFTFLFTYFFSVICVTVAAVLIYKLLKKYFPRFTAIITGGR